jgi:hypothetical protein
MMTTGTKQIASFWIGALTAPVFPRRKKHLGLARDGLARQTREARCATVQTTYSLVTILLF